MKLYQEMPDSEILERVIDLVNNSQQILLVAANELENSNVNPDARYFQALEQATTRGVQITRYYFGTPEAHHQEQQRNPYLSCLYAGPSKDYQRAIIADGYKSMSKVATKFVYSENPLWINTLQKYYASKK